MTTAAALHARRQLLERRALLLSLEAGNRDRESELLATPEADWEDLAAERRDAAVLDRLAAAQRAELARIDAALARLGAGTWGVCATCRKRIPFARLRVSPEAETCQPCALPMRSRAGAAARGT